MYQSCRQFCDVVTVVGDDNNEYALPVKDPNFCMSEGRTFTAGGASGTAAIQIFRFSAAVASSAFRTVDALCRNREAYVLIGVAHYFNRLVAVPDEYGFLIGNTEILYNNGEEPIREGATQCYLACFFCDAGGAANTTSVNAANALVAAGEPIDRQSCNMIDTPIIIGQDDELIYQWTPAITETPVNVDLIVIATFFGARTGRDCVPPQVKIPQARTRPTCEEASAMPPLSIPERLL